MPRGEHVATPATYPYEPAIIAYDGSETGRTLLVTYWAGPCDQDVSVRAVESTTYVDVTVRVVRRNDNCPALAEEKTIAVILERSLAGRAVVSHGQRVERS